MGSFASTCAVSGLPLEAGDPVRFLLLSSTPYPEENIKCYAHSEWFPRTIPIRAVYNSYGSIEGWEDGPAIEAILRMFDYDLIEIGMDDNTYHDVPCKKGMSFSELLKALWEARVFVKNEVTNSLDKILTTKRLRKACDALPEGEHKKTFEGFVKRTEEKLAPLNLEGLNVVKVWDPMPSLQNITMALEENFTEEFYVDEEFPGSVRVRYKGYGSVEDIVANLTKVKNLFDSYYATSITAGSGSYGYGAELNVRPQPSKDGNFIFFGKEKNKNSKLKVQPAMIKEEVWQALVKIAISYDNNEYGDFPLSLPDLSAEWDPNRDDTKEESLENLLSSFKDFGKLRNHNSLTLGIRDYVSYMEHFAIEGELDTAAEEDFIRTCQEFSVIESVLSMVRYWWHPSLTCGPQFGEWRLHELWNNTLAEISKREADKIDRID